jgi:hypothetical protein
MRSLRSSIIACAIVALLAPTVHAQANAPLRVIRSSPSGEASPSSAITVTFDRPVAGSFDRTVDPTSILSVQPPVPGKLEWRDPVTIRLLPSAPLIPGAHYTVTVAKSFRAMDGGQLDAPYQFVFRAQGPVLLTGSPVGDDGGRAQSAQHVAPNQRFELVYSAPVDLSKLSALTYAEFNVACAGSRRVVPLRATTQRRIGADDPGRYRYAGAYGRDRSADSLRRVVQLQVATPMPHGCNADLVAPTELSDELPHGYSRWPFQTYGDLRVTQLRCAYGRDYCPTGPLTLTFTNPVQGAEILRRVKIFPEEKFTVRDTTDESTGWTLDAKLQPHVTYAVVVDTAMRDAFGQSLRGNPALGYRTTGYSPSINYPYGRQLVERAGFRTLAIEHVNIDTLVAMIAPIPDSLEPKLLARPWGNSDLLNSLLKTAAPRRIPLKAAPDHPAVTGLVLPTPPPMPRSPPRSSP